jgi:uncharacterized protein YndB with AHSA1/START domain
MSPEQHEASGPRAIDLDIEVPGTPEEVWEAVASGPGITAWFVPARVDGRLGGTCELDFGPGVGVETARITAWEPPRRLVAEVAAEGRPAFAMEWLVEARDGGTCVVRLINSGFGSGADWDAEYDATEAGWRLFLYNLRLYLTHFPGRRCSSVLVNGHADGPVDRAFGELAAALGLPAGARAGEPVAATAPGAPPLAGVVERAAPNMLTLLLERPAAGIAFVVCEPAGDGSAHASVYLYLFGDGAAEAAARDEPGWRAWVQRHFPAAEAPADQHAEA